jgi:hypothetical protein
MWSKVRRTRVAFLANGTRDGTAGQYIANAPFIASAVLSLPHATRIFLVRSLRCHRRRRSKFLLEEDGRTLPTPCYHLRRSHVSRPL